MSFYTLTNVTILREDQDGGLVVCDKINGLRCRIPAEAIALRLPTLGEVNVKSWFKPRWTRHKQRRPSKRLTVTDNRLQGVLDQVRVHHGQDIKVPVTGDKYHIERNGERMFAFDMTKREAFLVLLTMLKLKGVDEV